LVIINLFIKLNDVIFILLSVLLLQVFSFTYSITFTFSFTISITNTNSNTIIISISITFEDIEHLETLKLKVILIVIEVPH